MILTQQKLKNYLFYNPYTGDFYWRWVDNSGTAKAGDRAGTLSRRDGHITIKIYGKRYLAHYLAWFYVYGDFPKKVVHLNRLRADNRIENLEKID